VKDRDGNSMRLPNLLEPVGLSLWMDGVYEPDVMRFLKESIRPDSVVVDVGANIGAFTIPLARQLRERGRVVAIEAAPSVAPVLALNVALNRLTNVVVVECAASTGEISHVPFYEAPSDHFGMGSSAPQFHVSPIEIAAMSLDRILRENNVSEVAVVKVDVEGFEAHVFQGAMELLHSPHRRPRIVFEFCDWAEERAFPGKRGWAQEILMQNSYRLWTLSEFLAGGQPLAAPLREGFDSIVAIPSTA
jgi:FkbM family methyltransferase